MAGDQEEVRRRIIAFDPEEADVLDVSALVKATKYLRANGYLDKVNGEYIADDEWHKGTEKKYSEEYYAYDVLKWTEQNVSE